MDNPSINVQFLSSSSDDGPEVVGASVGKVVIESRIFKISDVKFPFVASCTSLDYLGLVVVGFKTTKRITFD